VRGGEDQGLGGRCEARGVLVHGEGLLDGDEGEAEPAPPGLAEGVEVVGAKEGPGRGRRQPGHGGDEGRHQAGVVGDGEAVERRPARRTAGGEAETGIDDLVDGSGVGQETSEVVLGEVAVRAGALEESPRFQGVNKRRISGIRLTRASRTSRDARSAGEATW
jgi:hypothetical protein